MDLRSQRARKLRSADFEHFDWLLCADRSVLRDVRAMTPAGAHGQAALLLEWTGLGAGAEIPDPYMGGPEDFRRVWAMVDAAAAGLVTRLSAGRQGL